MGANVFLLALRAALASVAASGSSSVPLNAVTFNGQPVTFNGQPVVFTPR